MKSYRYFFLAAASAVALSSCVEPVVVDRGPSTYRRPYSSYDRSPSRYDHDRYDSSRYGHDRDGRYSSRYSRDPRSPYSPGGTVVLPSEARRITHGGQIYYTHRNVWYRPSGGTYVIVRSPY